MYVIEATGDAVIAPTGVTNQENDIPIKFKYNAGISVSFSKFARRSLTISNIQVFGFFFVFFATGTANETIIIDNDLEIAVRYNVGRSGSILIYREDGAEFDIRSASAITGATFESFSLTDPIAASSEVVIANSLVKPVGS